ncbi:MAG: PQQ-dependent sugar dehydrogenase [Pyrinomonadaceae bacterium]|nr:PQQ-dependent sugar dehydrogenase [Phycisphaerales bacterium]
MHNTEHVGFFRGACRTLAGLGLAAVGLLGLAPQASAQTLTTTRIVSGLTRPLYVTAPVADTSRLFVLEQFAGSTGRVRIVNIPANTLNPVPYLSISPVATGNEQGLLGIAFHPNFLANGYFYVNYTASNGTSITARYQANAPYATSTTANAASAQIILSIPDPFSNHNGGWMGFAPGDTSGELYIGMGDGGSGNDPNGAGQNINTLLGKMLRIDVDGPDNIPGNADDDGYPADATKLYTIPPSNPFAGATPGSDEIFAYGIRNPWRNSFDRANGNLYIADVGQNAVEEIDMQLGSATGINYGWRCMEGTSCTGLTGCVCNAPTLRLPIRTYTHSGGACSITGGYVYRGCAIPSINGMYFYADYCSSQISTFTYTGDGTTPAPASVNRTAELAPGAGLSITSITSFGEDALGEIYIVDQGGEIFKIIPRASISVDCDANGVQDPCQIFLNPALDTNDNGVIDSCETSACCTTSGCQQITEAACTAAGGTWQGLGRSCTEPDICTPAPITGACCVGTVCSIATQTDCTASKGTYQGDNTVCGKNTCPPPPATGACCVGTVCSIATAVDRRTAEGTYQGDNTVCGKNTCPPPATCPCDWNDDLTLTSQDFFDFLAGFFNDNGDFNGDMMTTSQDFFDFIACFFEPPAGCN